MGGIACYNQEGGIISQCTTQGTASTHGVVGGIVNFNEGGYISNCESSLFIIYESTAGDAIGGIAAYNTGNGKIDYCTNRGDFTITNAPHFYGVGGIVGRLFSGTVDNCQNDGSFEIADADAVGGIVGDASETFPEESNFTTRIITNCTNTGNVNGPSDVTGNMIGVLAGDESDMTGCTYGGTVNGATGTEANAIGKDLRSGESTGSDNSNASIDDIPTEEW